MNETPPSRERMTVVITGHVDHGKSTVIGRLLADTGSLPDGKLEQVKAFCARNARPFEYAFLLDALKESEKELQDLRRPPVNKNPPPVDKDW